MEIALSNNWGRIYHAINSSKRNYTNHALLWEVSAIMNIADCNKTMKYTVFKDNNGALEMAKTPKIRLRMKHIAIKYYHFYTYIEKEDILLEKIDIAEQEVDFLTKPLVLQLFCYLRWKVTG